MILLNPGPVNLSERVRAALGAPDLCHREAEFAELQALIRKRLLDVYALDEHEWAAVVLSGSGTAAVEAMLSSLVPDDGRLLIVENGVYGERMRRMAAVHGIAHDSLALTWETAIDTEALAERLAGGAFSHVAVVHHETTTGRLNDLTALGHVCHVHGVRLLVDAVSSFGAEALAFDEAPIDACAATANKCLHGAPGAGFVIARHAALTNACPRTLSLDLATWYRAQQAGDTPFTPAIPALYALAEALAEHREAGGWQARRAHYRQLAGQVADGLGALGVEPLLAAQASSCVLRAFRLPEATDYATLHDGLKQRGYVIYAGQGRLAEEIFRISTMGALGTAEMAGLLGAMRQVLNH